MIQGKFTRRRLTLGVLAVVLAYVGWWLLAYPRGMAMAVFDSMCGHYEVKTAGYPHPARWEYAKLLRKRYGVNLKAEAGCVVTPELIWFIDGYNSLSRPRIKTKFGKDIFAECWEEAEKDYRKSEQKEHPNRDD